MAELVQHFINTKQYGYAYSLNIINRHSILSTTFGLNNFGLLHLYESPQWMSCRCRLDILNRQICKKKISYIQVLNPRYNNTI